MITAKFKLAQIDRVSATNHIAGETVGYASCTAHFRDTVGRHVEVRGMPYGSDVGLVLGDDYVITVEPAPAA